MALGISSFVGDDIESMCNAARVNLALSTRFLFYQRIFGASGFAEEVAKAAQGATADEDGHYSLAIPL